METIDLYLQNLSQSKLNPIGFHLHSGGGTGGLLFKKKQWFQIGTIKDTKKHNRAQDLVIMQEISKLCTHIDGANLGSFLLKLPRTNLGFRNVKVNVVDNRLDFLIFEKNKNIINDKNIQIINHKNLPKDNLDYDLHVSLNNKTCITKLEITKNIFYCLSFLHFETDFKAKDIQFIIEITKIGK